MVFWDTIESVTTRFRIVRFNKSYVFPVYETQIYKFEFEFFQAGQEAFRSITRSYYRGAAGALLVPISQTI